MQLLDQSTTKIWPLPCLTFCTLPMISKSFMWHIIFLCMFPLLMWPLSILSPPCIYICLLFYLAILPLSLSLSLSLLYFNSLSNLLLFSHRSQQSIRLNFETVRSLNRLMVNGYNEWVDSAFNHWKIDGFLETIYLSIILLLLSLLALDKMLALLLHETKKKRLRPRA